MKRKWLIGLLSILMVLAVCFGFAACGGEGGGNGQGGGTQTDQEIADAAIDTLKTLYKDGETASAYKVLGQTKVNGAMYDIVWTATSSDVTDISDYVQIGTMDETSKQITITIVKGDEPITYKLKATVTVNEASASMEVTKTIPAKPKDAKGTKDDPYSAARVIELANEMEPKTKFDESTDNPPRVYVQGYIVDVGTDQTPNGYNRVGYVYIVDNYSSDKDKNSSDALMILSINYDADGPLTCFADLEVGKKIMVAGYIMLYQKNSNAEPQPEITYFGNNGITCEYLEKPERTPQEKAQIALDSVKNAYYYNAVGDIELPKSSDSSVTLAWTSADDTYKVEDGKLKIEALPQSDKVIDLTVTATCENVPVSKTVKVTIKAAVTQPQGSVLLTVDTLFPGNYSSAYADFNKDYTVGTHKVTTKQVMFSSDDSYLGAMQVQGSSSSHGSFTVEGHFVQVKITLRTSYTLVKPTVTEGSTSITGTADAGTADGKTTTNYDIKKYVITYTLKGSGNVTITNPDEHAMYISSIELSEGEDTRNAQEKVNAALAAVQTEYTVTAAGNYTLPVSTEPDVTFSWSKKTGNYNVGSDGKSLEIGAELPAEATDVVLILTATCGSETVTDNTKDVTFHISAKSVTPAGDLELLSLLSETEVKNGYKTGTYEVGGISVSVTEAGIYSSISVGGTFTPVGYNFLQFKKGTGKIELTGEFTKIVTVMLSNANNAYDADKLLTITAGSTKLALTNHSVTETQIGTATFNIYTEEYEVTTSGPQKITIANANTFALYAKSITLTGTAGGGSDVGGDDEVATEFSLTVDTLTIPSQAYTNSGNATIGGIQFNWVGMGNFGNGLQMRTNDTTGTSSFWNNEAFGKNIQQVTLTWSSKQSVNTKSNLLKVEFADNVEFTDAKSVLVTFEESTYNVAIPGEYKFVRITHNGSNTVYLDKVDIVCGDEAIHNHDYKCVKDSSTTPWEHKLHCDVAGCPEPDITEACEPVLNVCECGRTYTQEEIIAKLFGLTEAGDLKGTYVLEGTVKAAVEVGGSGDWKFDIIVDTDKTVQAYYVKHAGFRSFPEVGATVKVSGPLKLFVSGNNKTYEFNGGNLVEINGQTSEPADPNVVYSLNSDEQVAGKNSSYGGNGDVEVNKVTWNVEGNTNELPWRFGGKSITSTERKLTGKTAITGTVAQILLQFTDSGSITINSVTLKVYSNDPTADGATVVDTKEITYKKGENIIVTPSDGVEWTDCYYQIIFNVTVSGSSNKYVSILRLEFSKAPAAAANLEIPEAILPGDEH